MSSRFLGLARSTIRQQVLPASRSTFASSSSSQHAQMLRTRAYTSTTRPSPSSLPPRSGYSSTKPVTKPPSHTGSWSDNWPGAMVPIFLLSTAIFMSLSLLRTHLSHNRSLAESDDRIVALEAQLARLRGEAKRRQERERKERERILPLVVQSVLERVGALQPDVEEEVVEDRLLV